MITLEGKVAIVTGAARGIGAASARAIAAHGACVVLADIDFQACTATATAISDDIGIDTLPVFTDVSDPAQCEELLSACVKRFDRCDVLVNNAGIIARGSILDLTIEDFDRVLGVNLRGAFLVARVVAGHMVREKIQGAIINMSSTNSVVAIPNQLAYGVSKGGIGQLTRSMAIALAPHSIRVNAIGPGSINTDILKAVMSNEETRRMILSRTPLGRVGEPEEVACIVVFLASDYASYVTGQTIYPDGGRLPLNYTVPVVENSN